MKRVLTALLVFVVTSPASAQTFRRPTACSDCIANHYYFDRNGSDPGHEDWTCGTDSYNGHRGTDFSLAGNVDAIPAGHDIVAAADGTVISIEDGHYDRCRTCDSSVDGRCGTGFGSGYGNHVRITHGAYTVIYAHLRTGSVRVGRGDTVRCGDVIGQIGSSGCSTGAHVHFETRRSTTAFDPFESTCESSPSTVWTSQGPYRGLPSSACDGSPPPPTCPPDTWEIWTCSDDDTQRRRCIDGMDTIEDCPWGCDSMPTGTDDVCSAAPDADGDGYAADVDCADDDPARRPGAEEICGDTIDQDCDGSDLTCPGVDAGVIVPEPDAASIADGGTPSDAGGAEVGVITGTCGCGVPGGSGGAPGWLALLLVLLPLRRRRRRR